MNIFEKHSKSATKAQQIRMVLSVRSLHRIIFPISLYLQVNTPFGSSQQPLHRKFVGLFGHHFPFKLYKFWVFLFSFQASFFSNLLIIFKAIRFIAVVYATV